MDALAHLSLSVSSKKCGNEFKQEGVNVARREIVERTKRNWKYFRKVFKNI